VEGQAKDLDKKVDGAARQVSLRPAPVAVFDEDSGMRLMTGVMMRLGRVPWTPCAAGCPAC
jgi:hypothetical protein